jgi:hypothetical protein
MSSILAAIKAHASIVEIWSALGGGPLRRNRGVAFWRKGADGYNVSLDARLGVWHDFRDNVGGDVIALVMHVRQCSFREALEFLAAHTGVSPSPASGRRAARRDTDWPNDLRWARWWAIGAEALADWALEELPPWHQERRGLTELLNTIRLGDLSLVTLYREWREHQPRLTSALWRAGRRSDAHLQRRVALWLRRRANAQTA